MKTKLVENSSQISEIGYDEKEKIFQVTYKSNSSVYQYFNVEPETWEAAQTADSVGKYVAAHVKSHSFKRIS